MLKKSSHRSPRRDPAARWSASPLRGRPIRCAGGSRCGGDRCGTRSRGQPRICRGMSATTSGGNEHLPLPGRQERLEKRWARDGKDTATASDDGDIEGGLGGHRRAAGRAETPTGTGGATALAADPRLAGGRRATTSHLSPIAAASLLEPPMQPAEASDSRARCARPQRRKSRRCRRADLGIDAPGARSSRERETGVRWLIRFTQNGAPG